MTARLRRCSIRALREASLSSRCWKRRPTFVGSSSSSDAPAALEQVVGPDGHFGRVSMAG